MIGIVPRMTPEDYEANLRLLGRAIIRKMAMLALFKIVLQFTIRQLTKRLA